MTSLLAREFAPETMPLALQESLAEPARAPQDPITGQPYLILPVQMPGDQKDTYHHLWYYRKDPDLGGGRWPTKIETAKYQQIAGLSVRLSCGEYLMRSTHEAVHARFPAGPVLATEIADKFRIAVTGAVGIVPRKLIDVTQPKGSELIDVDDRTFDEVANPDTAGLEHFRNPRTKAEARSIVGNFILRYAIREDLTQLDHRLLERYVQAKRFAVKQEVGAEILDGALQLAIAPFQAQLEDFRQQGMVQPGRQDAITELRNLIPNHAYGLVIPSLKHYVSYARMARCRQLAAARAQVAVAS